MIYLGLNNFWNSADENFVVCVLVVNTSRGNNSVIFIIALFLSGGQLFKERICSCRSRFFHIRVDLILKVLLVPGKETESQKIYTHSSVFTHLLHDTELCVYTKRHVGTVARQISLIQSDASFMFMQQSVCTNSEKTVQTVQAELPVLLT